MRMALRHRRPLLVVAALVLAGSIAATGCSKSSKTAATTTTKATTTTTAATSVNTGATIEISEFQFNPQKVTIKAGQAVVWKNTGNVAHTVTETSTPHTFAS